MLFRTSNAKIAGPVTFLLYANFNDLDIQLILELKNSFGKYNQYVLKILKGRFLHTKWTSNNPK